MSWAHRTAGVIDGIAENESPHFAEQVADTHPDVVAFLAARAQQAADAQNPAWLFQNAPLMFKAMRALALVTMDEVNLLRQWIMSFKAAVAASSSLADLKTRVAALANVPDRTAAQAKAAVVARLGTPEAD